MPLSDICHISAFAGRADDRAAVGTRSGVGSGFQWGGDRERPEKESRPSPLQEWLRTITPIAALIFSVVALLVSSSTAVKVFVFPNPSPGASGATPAVTVTRPSTSPGSSPKEGGTSVPSQAQLTGAMLPADTLGSAASTASPTASSASAGTKPAQLRSICGALFPKGAALATARETLINNQTNQTLTEVITYWASKNAAGNAISQDSNAIAKADGQACSVDLGGRRMTLATQPPDHHRRSASLARRSA
jgi:hypothetical protein